MSKNMGFIDLQKHIHCLYNLIKGKENAIQLISPRKGKNNPILILDQHMKPAKINSKRKEKLMPNGC